MSSSLPEHTLLVKTLYRMILKEHLNSEFGRGIFLARAKRTRELFDRNVHLTDSGEIKSCVDTAIEWLRENRHPEPYIIPTQQGGSVFQRNTAPPIHVLHKEPDHPWPWPPR